MLSLRWLVGYIPLSMVLSIRGVARISLTGGHGVCRVIASLDEGSENF